MSENEELEAQMKMLEGLSLEEQPLNQQTKVVETAETLRGEVPFGSVTEPIQGQTVVANPTNVVDIMGPATQQITSQATNMPTAGLSQPQVNQQAAAQVVQQTTTIANPQPVHQHTMAPNTSTMNMNEAPVFVNLAASTYQTKTDFLTLKDGEKTRVTLANLNFIRNHIHYIEGLGKIKCLSQYDENNRWPVNRALCCQFTKKDDPTKYENAKNRLLVPVIEYPVSKTDGKTIIAGSQPKLKMWDMNYVEEKQLMGILEEYKSGEDWGSIDVNSFDLSLTKGKSGEYSTITLVAVPSWRNNHAAAINSEVQKINQDFYTDAFNESARTVSEEAIQKHLQSKQQENIVTQQLANQQFPGIDSVDLGY